MKSIIIVLLFFFVGCLSIVAQENKSGKMTYQDSVNAGFKVKMPQFIGGEARLQTFIMTFLRYPEDAVKDSIQGTVLIEFMISKTGKVTNVKVLNSLSPSCDAEAVRMVSLMPDWIPAEYKGENIPVIFKIPILFRFKR